MRHFFLLRFSRRAPARASWGLLTAVAFRLVCRRARSLRIGCSRGSFAVRSAVRARHPAEAQQLRALDANVFKRRPAVRARAPAALHKTPARRTNALVPDL